VLCGSAGAAAGGDTMQEHDHAFEVPVPMVMRPGTGPGGHQAGGAADRGPLPRSPDRGHRLRLAGSPLPPLPHPAGQI